MRFVPRAATRGLAVAAGAALLSACYPITLPGGSTSTCPQGTYSVGSETINGSLPTPYGTFQVALVSPGTLSVNIASSTWSLTGSGTLSVTGSTPLGLLAGQAAVSVNAGGGWTKSSSTQLSFTLSSAAGSVSFSGTLNGTPVARTFSLEEVGLDDVYGFAGSAAYSCSSSPALTLTFSTGSFSLEH